MGLSIQEVEAGAAAVCDCHRADTDLAGQCGVCKYIARVVLSAAESVRRPKKPKINVREFVKGL